MPAAAVTPAPRAYALIAAVKRLLVGLSCSGQDCMPSLWWCLKRELSTLRTNTILLQRLSSGHKTAPYQCTESRSVTSDKRHSSSEDSVCVSLMTRLYNPRFAVLE